MPNARFYLKFNGITLGVTAFLAYLGAVWALGVALVRWRLPPGERRDTVRGMFTREMTSFFVTALLMARSRRAAFAACASPRLSAAAPNHHSPHGRIFSPAPHLTLPPARPCCRRSTLL